MAVICKFCGGPHPWFDCSKKPEGWKPPKNEPGASAVTLGDYQRKPVSAPLVSETSRDAAARRSTVRPNPKAKATKANPRDDASMASEADGVASRLSAGRTAQGAPVKTVSAALAEKAVDQVKRRGRPLSPNPKSPRAAYQRDLMRKLRAKEKPDAV
jgi:hypothetical protein